MINNPQDIDKYKGKKHKGWRALRTTIREIIDTWLFIIYFEVIIYSHFAIAKGV